MLPIRRKVWNAISDSISNTITSKTIGISYDIREHIEFEIYTEIRKISNKVKDILRYNKL